MTHCVNINHPTVKDLSEKIGLPLTITAAKVSIWQENNSLEDFPKPEELIQFINYTKQSNTILVKDVNSIKTVLAIMENITSKMAEDTTLSYFTINKFNVEGFKNVLSKRNIHKDLIDFIIDTVEKNNLYGSNLSEIVSAINKNIILTSAGIEEYYNRMSGEADNILNSELKAFLKDKIGVDVIEDLVETFGSAHAVADLLNKTVSVFGKSNLKTLPEETGHFFFELLGKSNPLYKKLFDNVTTWSGYEKVRKQYSKVYVKQNKRGEFVPDEDKIRREAVAQAIGEAVVRNYKSSQGDMFFTLIQEAIDFIRELVSKIGKFNFDVVIDDIAKDILKKNIATLQQINDTNYKLRTYEETLLNEPTVKNIIDRLIKVGAILTGSLSYRSQGTVYRPIDEDVHDIDTKIMWNSYKGDIEGFLNKLKEEFPDMTIRTRADGTPLAWEDWKTQSSAILVHIEGFPVDLFFQWENYKEQSSVNGNVNWYDSFTAKLQMGRPKDMYDLLKWANFDRVNLNDISQNTTFFQLKDIEQELKDTKFFSQHNDMLFIKKHSYVDAIKVIAKYNKETPGLITVKKAQNFGAGGREIFYVKINEDLLTPDVPTQGVLFSSGKLDYSLKSIEILTNNLQKVAGWYKLLKNTDTFFNKLNKDLQIPKEQVELIRQEVEKTNSIEQALVNLQANYSYTVEINTAKTKDISQFNQEYNEHTRVFKYNGFEYRLDDYYAEESGIVYEKAPLNDLNNSITITEQEFNQAANNAGFNKKEDIPTQYYSNLTVPGGNNYTENEIATPAITPSIKGHAQFATNNGIGWFRSDDKENKILGWKEEDDFLNSETAQFNPLTKNDKIIFGHPGIGKTYLKESGKTSIIDFDTDYKSRINEEFNLPEGFKARNDFQKNHKEEYQKAVRKLWEEAKQEAKKTDKQLFASDMILLREFANDFDKVITISKDIFINRAKQRNDYTEGETEKWKTSLDTEISKIDKSKVINTDKYLSDLLEGNPKTRRILEVQSDLFQKWRNNFEFEGKKYTAEKDDKNVWYYYKNGNEINVNEYSKTWETFLDTYLDNEDAFIKLLQKDNNWVTFFVKSIIQDSVKKGYEKVLFPSGDTASKVEGHTTLTEELRRIDKKIAQETDKIKKPILEKFNSINEKILNLTSKKEVDRYNFDNSSGNISINNNKVYNAVKKGKFFSYTNLRTNEVFNTEFTQITPLLQFLNKQDFGEGITKENKEQKLNALLQEKERINKELENADIYLKDGLQYDIQRREQLKSEGIAKLKPIYNFYENTVTNILKKQFGKDNVKLITDEYGNTWNEVTIDATSLNKILFSTGKIKPGVAELFESNPELANIGTKEQYSQYLNTIFPDSKVKDIVYHGANEPIEGENFTKREGATGGGIWFSGSKKYAQIQMDRAQPSESLIGRKLRGAPTMYRVVLNIKNPKNFYDATGSLLVQTPREFEKQYDRKTNDAALFHHPNSKKPASSDSADQIVVFEPEQIHILGSKQDIEGFKKFTGNTTSTIDSSNELNQILIGYLAKFGISAEVMNATITKGNYTIFAFADFLKKTIAWAKGYESEIPEEAAHMIFEMVDTGIKDTIINLVMKTERFAQFKKDNPGLYSTDREYAKEVAGQLLAEEIKQEASGLQRMETSPVENWLQKFIKFVKKFFGKMDASEIDNQIRLKLGDLAQQVIKGETTGLSTANMETGSLFSSEKDFSQKLARSLEEKEKLIRAQSSNKITGATQLKLNILNQRIDELTTNQNYLSAFRVIWKEFKEAERNLSKDDVTPEQLNEAKRTIDLISRLDELVDMPSLSERLALNYEKLNTANNNLRKVWTEKQNNLIHKLSQEEGFIYSKQEITAPVVDISEFKKQSLSLDSSHIPILNIASSIFESVRRKNISEFIEYKKLADKMRARYSKEDFNKYFDENGRLITKVKSEYFAKERRMLNRFRYLVSRATDSGEIATLYKKRAEWYIKNNDYELTKEGLDLYNKTLKAIKEEYTEEDGSISKENQAYINKWVKENNPTTGIAYATGGSYTSGNKYWFKYLKATPKKAWLNDKYDSIKNDELYLFIINTLTQGIKKVPHAMTLDVGNFERVYNDFVFDINKSSFSFSKAVSGLGEWWDSTFKVTLTADDIAGNEHGIVDEDGNLRPIIKNKTLEDLQTEHIYKNPFDLLDKFYSLALSYEHKSEVEAGVWLLEDALKKQKALRTTKASIISRNDGKPETVEGGLHKAHDQLMYNIGAELYERTRTDDMSVELTTEEKARHDKALEEWQIKADEAAERGDEIPPKPIFKKASGVKTVDAMIDYTRLTLLGLKPLSAITNLMIGLSSNYRYAARNKDFDDNDLHWAFKKLMGNVVKYFTFGKGKVSPEVEKIANLAYKHGITSETLLEDSNKYSDKISQFLFTWQTSGEFVIAVQLLLAKMRRYKVTDLKGKERMLYDAFDKNGEWNTAEFGEQPEWTSEKHIVDGKNVSKLKKFNDELKVVRKRTQGDYIDPMYFKGKVIGRMFMLFRTWLPRAVYERFGDEVGDFKGTYRTYNSLRGKAYEKGGTGKVIKEIMMFLGVVTSKAANIPGIGHLGFKSLSELVSGKYDTHLKDLGLSDLDIENMRVNVREVQFVVYLLILGLVLKGLAGDDDDKELNYITNLTSRLYQDMTFFYSFDSAFSIIKDPIPLWKTVGDTYDVVDRGLELFQDDTYQSGWRKGKSKTWKEIQDLVPVLSSVQSTLSTMEQVYGQEAYKGQ